jgi:hypothetical protein
VGGPLQYSKGGRKIKKKKGSLGGKLRVERLSAIYLNLSKYFKKGITLTT